MTRRIDKEVHELLAEAGLLCRHCNSPALFTNDPTAVEPVPVRHQVSENQMRVEYIIPSVPVEPRLCYYHYKEIHGRFRFNQDLDDKLTRRTFVHRPRRVR
jgi:hypothetical protein